MIFKDRLCKTPGNKHHGTRTKSRKLGRPCLDCREQLATRNLRKAQAAKDTESRSEKDRVGQESIRKTTSSSRVTSEVASNGLPTSSSLSKSGYPNSESKSGNNRREKSILKDQPYSDPTSQYFCEAKKSNVHDSINPRHNTDYKRHMQALLTKSAQSTRRDSSVRNPSKATSVASNTSKNSASRGPGHAVSQDLSQYGYPSGDSRAPLSRSGSRPREYFPERGRALSRQRAPAGEGSRFQEVLSQGDQRDDRSDSGYGSTFAVNFCESPTANCEDFDQACAAEYFQGHQECGDEYFEGHQEAFDEDCGEDGG